MPSNHIQNSRRTEPRISIQDLHEVSFHVSTGEEILHIPIANISVKGLGFINRYELAFPKGTILKGVLAISGNEIEIQIEVVFSSDSNIGCIVSNVSEKYKKTVQEYFKTELSALSMSPVEGEYQCEEGEDMSYYEGSNNCYALIIKNGESLRRFKISYFGNVFEGGDKKMFSACQIVQDTEFDNFSKGGKVEISKPISNVDPDFKKDVLKYILALEFIENSDREKIIDLVEKKFV